MVVMNTSTFCAKCNEHATKIESLLSENIYLKSELAQLKRYIFGQRRERFIPKSNDQLPLDLDIDTKENIQVETERIEYVRRKRNVKITPHGRNEIPSHLPRNEIIIEPEERSSESKCIGKEVTEELEYRPGKLYVNRYIRLKYKEEDTEKIIIGTLPNRPIEKGIPGPGLLSHILVSKYVDHLPLYRQLKQFKREDIEISQSTMNDWIKYSSQLLEPLYQQLKKEVLKTDYLMIDETPIRVLDSKIKGKSHTGYFWVYYSPLNRMVFFDYRTNRSREGPNEILKDYHGYIQTDAYSGYEEVSKKEGIISVGCFAHARRYFEQAKDTDRKRSHWMLGKIGQLYGIERGLREQNASFKDRYAKRQKSSLPILSEIRNWLDKNMLEVLPKSSIGKAIGYMHSNWQRLIRYLDNGKLEIDNNLVENAIRPVALGRKNYLFKGSHKGAQRSAIIYSLLNTVNLQKINPWKYLRDTLIRIPDHSIKKLDELLPSNYQEPDE